MEHGYHMILCIYIPKTSVTRRGSFLSSIDLPLKFRISRRHLKLHGPPTCLNVPRLGWTCLAQLPIA